MGISAKLVADDRTIPDPYVFKLDRMWSITSGLMSCFLFFFSGGKHLFFDVCGVSFRCFQYYLSSGSVQLFGSFCWRCCGDANIEGTWFNLVGPKPPLKWSEHILVCLVTFKLSRRQAAIHRIRCFSSDIPAVQYLFALSWGNGKNPTFVLTFFCFWELFVQLKAQQWCFTISRALVDSLISYISLTLVGFYATCLSVARYTKLSYWANCNLL